MTTPQNIDSVNLNTETANTQNYFNNFFINPGTVSSDQDGAVISFFEQYTGGNTSSAKVLASAVIFTSLAQGINPMQVLTDFTKLPRGELNAYLAMFLNLNRKGTSYLGINNQPITNKYIQRAILV
jgi:hypothetical protein